MKVTNETLVENILGWAKAAKSFRHGGYQWSSEIVEDETSEDVTVLHLWGVELSTGLRRHLAVVGTTRNIGEDQVEVLSTDNGVWETIEAAFTSPEAA